MLMCDICKKLVMRTPERRPRCHSIVCITSLKQISYIASVYKFVTLRMFMFACQLLYGFYLKLPETSNYLSSFLETLW